MKQQAGIIPSVITTFSIVVSAFSLQVGTKKNTWAKRNQWKQRGTCSTCNQSAYKHRWICVFPMVSENGRASGGPSPDPHQTSLQPAHNSPLKTTAEVWGRQNSAKTTQKMSLGVKKKKKGERQKQMWAAWVCVCVCVRQWEADLFQFCDYWWLLILKIQINKLFELLISNSWLELFNNGGNVRCLVLSMWQNSNLIQYGN